MKCCSSLNLVHTYVVTISTIVKIYDAIHDKETSINTAFRSFLGPFTKLTLIMNQTPTYELRPTTYPVSHIERPLITGQQVGQLD